jgi:hypothetical protein
VKRLPLPLQTEFAACMRIARLGLTELPGPGIRKFPKGPAFI